MTNSTVKQKRVSITVGEKMLDRLDVLAEQYGVPRATMITMFIGQGVNSIEQINASVQNGTMFTQMKIDDRQD